MMNEYQSDSSDNDSADSIQGSQNEESLEEVMMNEEDDTNELSDAITDQDNENLGNDGGEKKLVGFVDAMSKILSQNVDEGKAPILSRRTTAQMRNIAKEKAEMKASKMNLKDKKVKEEKDLVLPGQMNIEYDKKLKKIATRGVVALFNTISKHQKSILSQEAIKNDKIKEMSKDNFLGMLKQQTGKSLETSQKKSGCSFVQDDFMMGAKLKDWDKDDDEENGEKDMWEKSDDEEEDEEDDDDEENNNNNIGFDMDPIVQDSLKPFKRPISSITFKDNKRKNRKKNRK